MHTLAAILRDGEEREGRGAMEASVSPLKTVICNPWIVDQELNSKLWTHRIETLVIEWLPGPGGAQPIIPEFDQEITGLGHLPKTVVVGR